MSERSSLPAIRESARFACAFLLAWSAGAPALAQPAAQTTPRDLRPQAPPAAAPVLPQPPSLVPSPAASGAALQVTVARVEVAGGFPEFAASTQALAARYAGRRVTVRELYELAAEIEQHHRLAGYLLVRVAIPPQQVQDGGVFRLVVLDGFIERLDLAGVDPRVRDKVEATLSPIVGRSRLTLAQLERVLVLGSRLPGVTLRSTLAPGTRAGGSVLVLQAAHERAGGSWGWDNRLPDNLGPWQQIVQARLNQPSGQGELVYVYAAGDPDPTRMASRNAVRRVAGGGVIVPLGHDGLALNAELTGSDTRNPGNLFIPATRSRFQRAVLRVSYPLVLSRSRELSLAGSLEASRQTTDLPAFHADLNQDRLRVLRIGADGTAAVGEAGRLQGSLLLSRGLRGWGARTPDDAARSGVALSRPGSDPGFTKLEASLRWEQVHASGIQLRTTLRGQAALGHTLPSSELFSLDGEDAISALAAGAFAADGGWTLRQEVGWQSVPQVLGADRPLSPYAFVAGGRPRDASGFASATSTTFGLGLRTNWKALSVSLEYGRVHVRPGDFRDTRLFMTGRVAF